MVTRDMKRILVADTPEAVEILRPVIGDGATLIPAFTVEEALAVVAQGVDMIVAGVHFDKSRMFDLLRMLHADRQLRNTPVVCVRLLTRNQSRATALDLAAVWRRMSPAVGPDAMVEGKQERHAVAATG